ncbi:cilia and flagella-associated protein 47-like isoform X3 [Mugil cephalus]|uniref:cilia and flagella-associated protein 47-like isoform X3 n=1 Tax=Mugil cephalus TaxID=48193 RepID=UPI001FB62482|nr:cilia and flagella-associated protein 47-like isoform X3 [Mugil cephalus]
MDGSCVRVDPPFVEFSDVKVGQVYRVSVTATNVGKTSKKISIEKPRSKLFRFTSSSPAGVVAPGLSVSGLLEFTPEEEEEVRDHLLIHTDDADTLKIPLRGLPRACSLVMDSMLDFGCVVASSQVISKQHPITNRGSAPGLFQVQYTGDSSLRISPSTGIIAAGATQWLKAELRTDRPRQIEEKALVKLQNRSAVVLSIRAELVDQQLELFDLQGNPLSCLWFGPVYFGTSCVESVVLRNNSPQACDWVCQLQDSVAGTEVGSNLQKTTDAALLERGEKCNRAPCDVSQVFVCVPKYGRLGPYEEMTVKLRFSPVCKSAMTRQDYCLFLLFQTVRRKHGFTNHNADSSVELAVTGSGFSVSLVPSPSDRFDFLRCAKGQRVDLHCALQNLCPQLPVAFRFRKIAHFTAEPSAGSIAPGQRQDVVLSFSARQQGSFQVCQKLDVLGHVVCQSNDNATEDGTELKICSFHAITLHLSAVCCSETTQPVPKLNHAAGTNAPGSWPHVRCSDLARCREVAPAAVLSADKTRLHRHRGERSRDAEEDGFLAFPNDRPCSIRPASSHGQYRTIFTGVPRYRYVDTSYAFTADEEEQRQRHRQNYADFIRQLRQARVQKIEERRQGDVEDDVDIGIIPSQGLVPPTLGISDLERPKISETKPNYKHGSPETKRRCLQDKISGQSKVGSQQVSKVMRAVPCTSQEMADCYRNLTAMELYQVDIGPLLVDFGAVCVNSVCVQKLVLANRLSAHVWVQVEVDCPELQGSSPLSHVLPPRSHTTLPLTFQTNKLGPFYRPVSYSINRKHPGQILVRAQVVPLALELSTNLLVLRPDPNLLAASGYRSSVTLRNPCNHAAEFTWRPVVTERGILFSVRPATGVVEPYSELDCEVVWHPSFSSPSEGDFDLCVQDGNSERLHCVAEVGATSVQLAEKHIVFESVPLNMPSTRTAVLHNTGRNHAYYQVLDVCPLPGMVVSPCEGVVPSRGQATLKIHFNPDCVMKFDARVEIALRNMKSAELRVGGSVEPPNVDISVSHFQFYGVHAGSRRLIPFALTNHSSAAARVALDLSEHKNFSVRLPRPSEKRESGWSVVDIQAHQTADCSLSFSPSQMATYYFDLPMMVNGVRWPASSLHPFPTQSSLSSSSSSSLRTSSSRRHVVKTFSHPSSSTQQAPCVQATVLCAPLEMSPSSLEFHVEPQFENYTKEVELKAAGEESACWRGATGGRVDWWFGCNGGGEEELCTASPPGGSLGPGQSVSVVISIRTEAVRKGCDRVTKLSLPLYLGRKGEEATGEEETPQPYRELSVIVTDWHPSITFHPPQILLTPAPLDRDSAATLTLLAAGYPSGTRLSAEVDDVEAEDGTRVRPVSVAFPAGDTVAARDADQAAHGSTLQCSVSFCSAVPLSLCTTITFTDHLHNRFKVKLCAVADNCVLTAWPYMALHNSKQQIVLKTGATAVEATFQLYETPSPASVQTSSPSSFDHNSSASKNSESLSDSDSLGRRASGDTNSCACRGTPANLSVPRFPAADTEEGLYHLNVLLAVERWFSLFGWPGAPYPITVPHTLRRVASKIQTNHSNGRTYRVSQSKDSRSVVDMLHHLTGKQIPGIPRCQTFSSDAEQRTNQLLQQHEAMLTFLRVQGASLCHIRPEYLLDALEFKHWCSTQSNKESAEHGLDYSNVDFESLSKRSWTDVLLQIYKVLVLRRVSKSSRNTTLSRKDVGGILPVGSQPLASNIYSSWELQLLSWLNMHYQSMRKSIWDAGEAPSDRWIVNFDLDLTDGVVLAALLAAHCPYLIRSHFRRMYTRASSLEQILHNNIIVAQALTVLGLNINIQPIDLSDPNPVQMLILCVHLYERLPQYVPTHTITLSGDLHSTFSKQVRLKSSSSKPVKYQAYLLGEDAHLFSLPDGNVVTIPPKSSAELTVQFGCSFLQPMEAVLLLVSTSTFGLCRTTLTFGLKTHVTHITPTNTVKCKSPCYQMKVIRVPLINTFNEEATFRVVLVESTFNPLEPDTKKCSLVQQASFKANAEKTAEEASGEEMEGGEDSEFLSSVRSVCLKSGQEDTLSISYLPFSTGTKYCSVLLVCPKVGDMVYIVKATSELPLPSPVTARPSSNVVSKPRNSDTAVCVSVISLQCEVGQVCEEVLRVPRINMMWEQALAIWGQHFMSADERRRRELTHTLRSSTVRAAAAARKLSGRLLLRGMSQRKAVEYTVEASLPQYFTLPSTVTIPIQENTNISWENPAECGYVDVPLRFQADTEGELRCQVVLKSWCDTRVYLLEALVTRKVVSFHLDLSSPARRSVTHHIPLHNDTQQDWKFQAEVSGVGFSGPDVLNVPAGTKAYYPLTFCPATQCTFMGKLSLRNDRGGAERLFTLRGVGEHPLPEDRVVLHCPVGKTTHTQLNVPNYSHDKLTLKVVTDLSVVSGAPSLKIEPGRSAPFALAVSPWKRGKQTGSVSFVETRHMQGGDKKDKGDALGRYEVRFSLEIVCEPAAPVEVIHIQCVTQSSVAIEIPVNNPGGEPLMLDVDVEGGDMSGGRSVSLPPRGTVTYKASFSPSGVGKSTGSVVFQSELVGEFWYQLELYALPPPLVTLPQASCQLGKWTRLNIPVVNPTAEPLELTVSNTNPRNYTLLEMESESTLIVEPRSSAQLAVRFCPSAIGERNHEAKITFACPQLQEWCVLLSGRGLQPEREKPLSISAMIGSSASIAVPFTNPTDLPAELSVKLTDEELRGAPSRDPVTGQEVFSIPLSRTEAIQVGERGTVDVPVVFAPHSAELQRACLCITMKPTSSLGKNFNAEEAVRSDEELSNICWTHPLCGIPKQAPVEMCSLGEVRCEVGCQLEKTADVLLAGCAPGNPDQNGQEAALVKMEDFQCQVRSDSKEERSEVEDCLSASVVSAKRDPENGAVALALNLVYTPLSACSCLGILSVESTSGQTWTFPITLIATEPQVDDVIVTETTNLGSTSAVGFRLTSTTRKTEPFTATFLPGSSSNFTVTPVSGMLPPVGCTGALITVSFTPTASSERHTARLAIQAADMRWIYEVRGKTSSPLCDTSAKGSSSTLGPSEERRRRNFVVRNLQLPSLANSSPLNVPR